MRGMNAETGKLMDDLDHLYQSIQRILTTRIGTRVQRRPFGSELPNLVDTPASPESLIDIYAETAVALDRWEPRYQLSEVKAVEVSPGGRIVIDLRGIYLPDGRELTLEGIQIERV